MDPELSTTPLHKPDLEAVPKQGAFFNRDFTPEDLILYIFCFCLVGFIGFYFISVSESSRADFMSASDRAMMTKLELCTLKGDGLRENIIKAQLQMAYKRYEYGARFEHTNSLIKFIGFMVGTLLTILGAVVIVKGVRDSPIGLEVSGLARAQVKFTASSPGLFLTLIGGAIILTTIVHTIAAEVQDPTFNVPIFVSDGQLLSTTADTTKTKP
jgi:hypothetical protein